MQSRQVILIVTLAVIVAAAAYLIFQGTGSQPATETQAPVTEQLPAVTSSPDIPTPIPIKPQSAQGSVTAVNSTTMSVNVDGKSVDYPIANTGDIQKIVSGSFATADVKTAQVKVSDIKVGNEVKVIVDTNTAKVVSILIIK